MSARLFFAGIALVGTLTTPARADDVSAGVAPGPITAAPAGRTHVTAIRVALAGRQIEVATALSVERLPVTLHLDLPRFGWLGEAEIYPDRHFPELKISVDGKPATVPSSFSAWKGGRDVSALVRAAGVDAFAVAETPPIVAPVRGRQPAFAALLAAGAVTRAPEGMLAGWDVQRHIAVPLGSGLHNVIIRYKARQALTLAQLPTPGDAAMWADFCLTPARAAALLNNHRNGRTVAMDRYRIPIGVNGQTPPRISLRMNAPPAGAMTVVCGADGRPAINATGSRLVRAGRDNALHILYVSAVR
jgi:hypothetical protein